MKKLLLIASLLLSATAFAQEIGDGTTPETAIGDPSPWVLKVNRTQPEGNTTYYYIPITENFKGNDEIYTLEVTLPCMPHGWQQSCYYLTASYTAEDGKKTDVVFTSGQSASNGSRYDIPNGSSDVSLVVSAWGTSNAVWSIKEYTLCDAKWTAFGYFSGNTVGNKSQRIYFYNPTEKSLNSRYYGGYSGGEGTVDKIYVTGANPSGTFGVNQSSIANPGVNTAVIDYTTGMIEIEAATQLPVYIEGLTTFVAPASLTLPDNVKAYTIESYEDGKVYLKELETSQIEAFQPVVLTSTDKGTYIFDIPKDIDFASNHEDILYRTGDYKYLKDAEVSLGEFTFCGVNQFHNLPANSYTLTSEGFVLNEATKNIMNPFTCYLKYTGGEEAPESIEVVFPVEEEEPQPAEKVVKYYLHYTDKEGNYISTFQGSSERFSYFWDYDNDGIYLLEYIKFDSDTYFVISASAIDGIVEQPSGDEINDVERGTTYMSPRKVTNASSWEGFEGTVYGLGENNKVAEFDPTTDNVTPFKGEQNVTQAKKILFTPPTEETEGSFEIKDSDIPTGIDAVTVSKGIDGAIYNVYGQRVDESYKGIVIKNGKKFIQR